MSTLSKYEKETIVSFNEDEDTASVYTRSKPVKTKLARLTLKNPLCVKEYEDELGQCYRMPKSWVTFRIPPAYSEKTRAEMAARAKLLSEQKKTLIRKKEN